MQQYPGFLPNILFMYMHPCTHVHPPTHTHRLSHTQIHTNLDAGVPPDGLEGGVPSLIDGTNTCNPPAQIEIETTDERYKHNCYLIWQILPF